MAYKVFTNGSVLNASEVNENLMQQAVATFSNAAARTAAIPSPVEGQVTYLADVDRYDHWTGGAWISPFGLTRLNQTTFTSQTAVTVSNVFTSAYKNYVVQFHASGGTNNLDVQVQLSLSGTPSTTGYLDVTSGNNSTTVGDRWPFTSLMNPTIVGASFEIFNPALAQKTTYTNNYFYDDNSTFSYRRMGGVHRVATAYDGFRLICSSAFSGTITTFGVRNA